MAVKGDGTGIPMRALTAGKVAEMAEEKPVREALKRYLTPLSLFDRTQRRQRLNKVAGQIALRMEHGHGGDTLTRARERLACHERQADALRAEGREPSRWQDLRRVAAAKVYWIFRDRIEKPAGLNGYEWAAIRREDGR